MSHTPGPWIADGPDMFGDFNILHLADSLAVGALVSNMRSPAEVQANAHLAAAAPELLEALLTLVKRTPFTPHADGISLTLSFEQIGQHKALLAKATGAQ